MNPQKHTHTGRQLCGRVNVRLNLLSTLTLTPTSLLTASAKRFGCGCGSGSVDEPSSWPKDAQPATIVCARNSTGATSVLSACNTKWQALLKLCLDSSVISWTVAKGKKEKESSVKVKMPHCHYDWLATATLGKLQVATATFGNF